jgi:hypothetical protein
LYFDLSFFRQNANPTNPVTQEHRELTFIVNMSRPRLRPKQEAA